MEPTNRREFLRKTCPMAGLAVSAPAFIPGLVKSSPNERVNVAVTGISGERPRERGMISGRGMVHIRAYAKVPHVRVATICDVDERLHPRVVAEVEKLFDAKPKTEVDVRKVLEDKEIDAISVATPDHWHALMTVWGCQAGKDVYVEKPVCHNISEGRKMVQAARKHDRIVQAGIAWRSSNAVKAAAQFIRDGKLGKVYMAKGIVYAYRPSIGHVADSPIPAGVHWDLFLGPAPYRPFNLNRYIYTWHWFWDTSTTEFGNNGIYRMDGARWVLNKNEHPVKVHCGGGLFCRDSDQEVPNIMAAIYEYADGTIIQNEVRSLYSNPEGIEPRDDCFLYGSEGWMALSPRGFKTYLGPKNEPGPAVSEADVPKEITGGMWANFVDCVRSRKQQDLLCDILEGHLSTAIGHLGVVSYRVGHSLAFDPKTEKFVNDEKANSYLTRDYRPPYVMPEI